MVHKKLRFPNTHNIDDLLKILKSVDLESASALEKTAVLSDYAIAFSYPDAAKEELTIEKAKELVRIADEALKLILDKLNEPY